MNYTATMASMLALAGALACVPDPAPIDASTQASSSGTESGSDASSGDPDTSTSSETETGALTETGAPSETGTESETGADAETDAETEAGSESETGEDTDTDTDTGMDSEGSLDMGAPEPEPDPIACPAPAPTMSLAVFGAMFTNEGTTNYNASSCDLPAHVQLEVSPEGTTLFGGGCGGGEADFEFTFVTNLPNNNWSPAFNPGVFTGDCWDVYFYTEPTNNDNCRLARIDIVDPDFPEVPVYSVGSTSVHLNENGMEIEAVDPTPCETDCRSGSVYDLRVASGGAELVLEAGAFPWQILEVGDNAYRVIRFDSIDYGPSEGEGCEAEPALVRNAWASVLIP